MPTRASYALLCGTGDPERVSTRAVAAGPSSPRCFAIRASQLCGATLGVLGARRKRRPPGALSRAATRKCALSVAGGIGICGVIDGMLLSVRTVVRGLDATLGAAPWE